MTQPDRSCSWTFGGLVGSAVGCSAWMVLIPFVADWNLAGTAIALICAIAILLTIPVLWKIREKVDALQGMFILLTVAFLSTLGLLLYAYFMRLPLSNFWLPTKQVANLSYFWVLLIYPAIALFSWINNRSNKQTK